ncbi:MAG: SDR family oxidoreductase [Merismopedia sp. SIO2A8]|nr:SDR family oxidoreductase [Symploca sp. SIO2B6]NET47700.1 SDR family oxidoreductase [Merismopedia sp. SIO2A8]
MSKTLLITGASGFLGWYVCQEAQRQGWAVHGTYHTHPIQLPDVTVHQLDLRHLDAVQDAIAHIAPDAVIHAAAQARPNRCEIDPDAAYQSNVIASIHLAETLGRSRPGGIPCVFVSSNQVFDGRHAPYNETDAVCPINVYGHQKVTAEQEVLARNPAALVCRMPLMFGSAPTAPSFLQGFLQRLDQGEPLNLFMDEFRTPLSGMDAAKGLLLAINTMVGKTERLLHLGGPERLSRYEFGQILVAVLGLNESRITACCQTDLQMAAARAPDLTMDSRRAIALGFTPMSVRSALEQLKLK